MRFILVLLILCASYSYSEDVPVKIFELNDGKKIEVLRFMAVTIEKKTQYQAKLPNGKSLTIKGEDVKEITDGILTEGSVDGKTAERLKNEADQSSRIQNQRALISEKDKQLTEQYTEVMREYLAAQTELKIRKDAYNAKQGALNSAKAQIPISESAIITSDADYRAATILARTDSALAQSRMENARSEITKHNRLLAAARETIAQIEPTLPKLESDLRAAEVVVKEHQNALQEIKELQKSKGVVNPLK